MKLFLTIVAAILTAAVLIGAVVWLKMDQERGRSIRRETLRLQREQQTEGRPDIDELARQQEKED